MKSEGWEAGDFREEALGGNVRRRVSGEADKGGGIKWKVKWEGERSLRGGARCGRLRGAGCEVVMAGNTFFLCSASRSGRFVEHVLGSRSCYWRRET